MVINLFAFYCKDMVLSISLTIIWAQSRPAKKNNRITTKDIDLYTKSKLTHQVLRISLFVTQAKSELDRTLLKFNMGKQSILEILYNIDINTPIYI